MVKFTSKILLVALVIASLDVEGKRKKGKGGKKKGNKPKKIVEAADLIRQLRGKDVSHSDPFRWDDKYETTLLEGNKFDREENKEKEENEKEVNSKGKKVEEEDDGGWKDEEELKNEIPSSVGYINGQAYIKNPNYPPYLTKPGLRKKLKGKKRGRKNKTKNTSKNNENMGDLLSAGKRSAPVQNSPPRRRQKQTNKRIPYHKVYGQKCWNGIFEPEDGMIVDARSAIEILNRPAVATNVISIPAGKRWNDFKNYDILYKKWDAAVKADAQFIPPKPLDDMSYIQNVWTTVSTEYPEAKHKFMLACSNLQQCQNYLNILKLKGLETCIYDGDYNDVLENDNTNAFFLGLDGNNAKPGSWARSFGDGEGEGEEGEDENGSGFMDPFYALDLAMPDYSISGDYSEDDYWYEEIPKVHEIGKTCSREHRLSFKAKTKCDGWKNTSKEQCVQKCADNELPDRCPQSDEVCKYAIWNGASGWCHVASSCDFVESFDGIPADRFTENEIIEV